MTAQGTYVSTTTLKDRLGGTAAMGTADDTLLGDICDAVNTYIEQVTGRVVASYGTAAGTVVFDIDEDTRYLYVKQGVRALTSVEVAPYTGAAYSTVTSGDLFLRPTTPPPGWPYTVIRLSDVPAGTVSFFPRGLATVRLVGTLGWSAVPEDLEDVAISLAVRTWHGRQSGQTDIVGTDEMGAPIVSRGMSKRDRDTLFRYTVAPTAL